MHVRYVHVHVWYVHVACAALAAAAIRFRVAAMLPAATQAGTYLGTTHRQAGVPRKRPAGRRRASQVLELPPIQYEGLELR